MGGEVGTDSDYSVLGKESMFNKKDERRKLHNQATRMYTHTITKHVLYGFIWTKNFGVSIIAFLGHMKPIEWRLGITTVNSIVYKSPAPYLIRVPQHLYLTEYDSACVPQRSNLSFLSLFHDLPTLSIKLIYWLQIKLRWRNLKTDPPTKEKKQFSKLKQSNNLDIVWKRGNYMWCKET